MRAARVTYGALYSLVEWGGRYVTLARRRAALLDTEALLVKHGFISEFNDEGYCDEDQT